MGREDRRHGKSSRSSDERSEGQRDRDRILYSSALRRLGGVTQVVSPSERALIHNRLTHSLEVAQIGRGLADTLLAKPGGREAAIAAGGLDPFVVEAAALAHDLGHPPFGHVAEEELNRLLDHAIPHDGFEGNAQSFRIVTKLAVRHDDIYGLDLTRASLCAMLKYPWKRGTPGRNPHKWGAYTTELDDMDWATEMLREVDAERSLEAAIMDWADDIAYAVHDLEDFFRAGLIPLDRLVTDQNERDEFLAAEFLRQSEQGEPDKSAMAAALNRVMDMGPASLPYRGIHNDRASLRSFTSRLIGRYINAVDFSGTASGEDAIGIDDELQLEVGVLKGLTWYYVIDSESLASQRFGQRSLIRSLFIALRKAVRDPKKWNVFPAFFQEMLGAVRGDAEKMRIVADYISSMTETQAISMHQRLTGSALGSAIEHRPY
ncbi:MAG: deoxyguanosinetriphosphate triphosphohydrolase family protein [Thermomicrobiales bacterium]